MTAFPEAGGRPPAEHRNEILCVQALRGFAVLMVLIVHVEDMAHRLPGFANFHSWYSERIGYSAPDLFFVISGFIMSFITFSQPFKPRAWVVGRFVRIYPLYALFSLFALGILLGRPGQPVMGSGPHDAWSVLASILILPQPGLPILFVGWTVQHEVVFYLIVFLVAHFLGKRMLVPVLAVLSCLALLRWIAVHRWGVPDVWDWNLLSLYLWQFLFGALVFQFRGPLRRLGTVASFLLAAGSILAGAAFAESGLIGEEQPSRVVLFGLAYALILLGLLNREEWLRAAGRLDLRRRSALVQMGDASYSMYLVHPFVLASFGHLGERWGISGVPAYGWMAMAYGSVIAAGLLLYPTLEKPTIRFFRRLLAQRGRSTVVRPA